MSKRQQQHVTAIVYDRRGRVLSIGQNSYVKTHTLMYKAGASVGKPDSIYLHAEVAAIAKLPDVSKAYRIFVSRHTKDGKPALAKPCSICERVIQSTAIKRVEYTI